SEEEPAIISPFSQADMPEWLSTFGDKQDEPVGEARTDEGAGLTPAELPSWLKAMRPVEAIARNTEDLDREVAKFGPLAGMQGVLPGEKSALMYGKPPAYSNKLEVTERQKTQAALLDALLAESRRPQPPQAEPSTLPGRLLRMAAGIILVLAVLVPLLLGANVFTLPVSYPAYVADFHNKIETLPGNAAVLLVFDYEPGLSGELNTMAQPVLMRLMQKNLRLASVTTIPAGIVMAENLITTVKRDQPAFNLESNYRNLGFLPGNATGVRQFGSSPLQIDFQGISRISDFSAIIIISDSLEGGQAWIEQIGQQVSAPPMLMILSAQAAPILQPYYRSGQVAGMLVGLPGSVAYSQITGSPSRVSSYWDSYQAGLLVIIGLMVVGGFWQLISTLLRKKA
ncbi:MAG: hypothetical protein HGA53_01515, partial [Anaerolineaceae bacterium]|nr:hypothetical protein [Anaerolineaceae bacterium]